MAPGSCIATGLCCTVVRRESLCKSVSHIAVVAETLEGVGCESGGDANSFVEAASEPLHKLALSFSVALLKIQLRALSKSNRCSRIQHQETGRFPTCMPPASLMVRGVGHRVARSCQCSLPNGPRGQRDTRVTPGYTPDMFRGPLAGDGTRTALEGVFFFASPGATTQREAQAKPLYALSKSTASQRRPSRRLRAWNRSW